jgi:hypothetical protein
MEIIARLIERLYGLILLDVVRGERIPFGSFMGIITE